MPLKGYSCHQQSSQKQCQDLFTNKQPNMRENLKDFIASMRINELTVIVVEINSKDRCECQITKKGSKSQRSLLFKMESYIVIIL